MGPGKRGPSWSLRRFGRVLDGLRGCIPALTAQHGRTGADGGTAHGRGDKPWSQAIQDASGERTVEASTIPETRFRAAEASVTGFDGPGGAAIPSDRGAGIVRDRTFAPDFIEAPAFASTLIIETLGELARLIKRTSIAPVMDCFAIKGDRATQGV